MVAAVAVAVAVRALPGSSAGLPRFASELPNPIEFHRKKVTKKSDLHGAKPFHPY
mgnify:CR=1 FL=1